jgi:hypothetical protein
MNALNWLNRLRTNESGNIIAIGAAAMPMLIGSAALAVDTIQLSLWKRELQRAADSGAIAGAYALAQNRSDAQIAATVTDDLTKNPHPPLVDTDVVRGPRAGYTRAVHVSLTAERTLPFMNMFTGTPARLNADAAAAIVSQGRYCMVSLYEGTQPGITVNGNASVTLGCGMITNSRAASAITSGGSSSITASPVAAVGGLDGDGNNFEGETDLIPYTTPQSDPYAHVPNPNTSGCGTSPPPLSVSNGQNLSITVGSAGACYSSLDIPPNGTLTINGTGPLIIYGGDATIQGDVRLGTGSGGATLVMTGPETSPGSGTVSAGNLNMNAQANFSVTAPTEGDYAGLVFYRDRRAPASTITIRGGATSTIKGAFYAANSNFDYAGNSGLTAECLQMVGQRIRFIGTADLLNECPEDSDVSPAQRSIVRLVE